MIELKTVEEARAMLHDSLKYFRHAIDQAVSEQDRAEMMIVAVDSATGERKIILSCECDQFFNDIALVCAAPADTEEDKLEAVALQFLQTHGIKHEDEE